MTDIELPDPRDDLATAEDVAELNRMAVERSAAFARIAGTVMLVVGVLGALAWLWIVVRTQLAMGDEDTLTVVPTVVGLDNAVSFADRVDAATTYLTHLLLAVLLGGAGLALRGMSDYAVARTGGSLTGFRVGDPLTAPGPDIALDR